ncbi:MAG: amidohydrolase family protein [Clostridia bacterium]|nr:amidohydrolase family protein [Clostridia bacterium]
MTQIIKGHIIYTESPESLTIVENGYLIFEKDQIVGVTDQLPEIYQSLDVEDLGDVLIVPGFYDLHTHGGQYPQCGIGMSHHLLDWLKDYTYELERKFEEPAFAKRVYAFFAEALISYGTLGAAVFGTSSFMGTQILFDTFIDKGLRGYIGKVCMTRNAPDFIIKDMATNIEDMHRLVERYKDQERVKLIVTPRFAPTSTHESLEALGQLSKEHDLPVQSHLDETVDEIKWVHSLYGSESYASLYDQHGLYGQRPTLMAHGIYLDEEEMTLTQKRGVMLVHCPDSNLNIASGIMPVRKYMNQGILVGLGTDIAGGHRISMAEATVRCVQLSKQLSVEKPEYQPLLFSEAYHMATAVGGSFFGRVGKLKAGFKMDCLVIDDLPLYKELYSVADRLEKFVYTGDDRWIIRRYIDGQRL